MKLFLQKTAKFSSAGGSAPRPPNQPPSLRISAYEPVLEPVQLPIKTLANHVI